MIAMWLLRRLLRHVVSRARIASFGKRPLIDIQITTEDGEQWRICQGKFVQIKGSGWTPPNRDVFYSGKVYDPTAEMRQQA